MAITLAACSFARVTFNTTVTSQDVAFIVPGQTTLAQVVEKLGAPHFMADSERGTVATYQFLNVKYSRVNFGWLLKPWTPASPDMVMAGTGFGTEAFQVVLDDSWVVTSHGFTHHVTDPRFDPWPF